MALTTNLVSYWKLDESSGNASDSVGGITLTNNGTVTYGTGKINNSANFGTTGNSKSLRTTNTLGIDGGNITISTWVKKNIILNNKYYFSGYQKNGTSKIEYRLGFDKWNGTEKLVFTRGKIGVADNDAWYTTTLDTNWHHLVGTYDGTNVLVYLDGTQVGTVVSSGIGTSAFYTNGFSIGTNNDNSAFTENGIMVDEVGVWTRALSSTEITQLYNLGNGLSYPFGNNPGFFNLMMN